MVEGQRMGSYEAYTHAVDRMSASEKAGGRADKGGKGRDLAAYSGDEQGQRNRQPGKGGDRHASKGGAGGKHWQQSQNWMGPLSNPPSRPIGLGETGVASSFLASGGKARAKPGGGRDGSVGKGEKGHGKHLKGLLGLGLPPPSHMDSGGSAPLSGGALLSLLKASTSPSSSSTRCCRYSKDELLALAQSPLSQVKPSNLDFIVDKENLSSPLLLRPRPEKPRHRDYYPSDEEEDVVQKPPQSEPSSLISPSSPLSPESPQQDEGGRDDAVGDQCPVPDRGRKATAVDVPFEEAQDNLFGQHCFGPTNLFVADDEDDLVNGSRGFGKWFASAAAGGPSAGRSHQRQAPPRSPAQPPSSSPTLASPSAAPKAPAAPLLTDRGLPSQECVPMPNFASGRVAAASVGGGRPTGAEMQQPLMFAGGGSGCGANFAPTRDMQAHHLMSHQFGGSGAGGGSYAPPKQHGGKLSVAELFDSVRGKELPPVPTGLLMNNPVAESDEARVRREMLLRMQQQHAWMAQQQLLQRQQMSSMTQPHLAAHTAGYEAAYSQAAAAVANGLAAEEQQRLALSRRQQAALEACGQAQAALRLAREGGSAASRTAATGGMYGNPYACGNPYADSLAGAYGAAQAPSSCAAARGLGGPAKPAHGLSPAALRPNGPNGPPLSLGEAPADEEDDAGCSQS